MKIKGDYMCKALVTVPSTLYALNDDNDNSNGIKNML